MLFCNLPRQATLKGREDLLALGASFVLFSTAAGAGWLLGFDLLALRAAQAYPAGYLDAAGAYFSTFGRVEVSSPLFGLVVLFVFVRGERRLATRLLVAFVLVSLVEVLLKFHLPAPPMPKGIARLQDFAPLIDSGSPYPYPSGHALRTTFLLGALCLLWRNRTIWTVCAIFFVGMATSRVYLGVHWASDVVGGALLGLAGLAWAFDKGSRDKRKSSRQQRGNSSTPPAPPEHSPSNASS